MTLEDMIALYRAQAMDIADPPFCSDELLTIYANEGQDEACRRGQLIRDASSTMCTVAYAAGDESVAVDARIVQVLRAFVDGYPVDVIGSDQMDVFMPGWHASASAARPSKLVAGLSVGALHLWPTPSQAGQVKLHVLRMPIKKLANEIDKPEIRPELHQALVEWMLYRAYSRDDPDMNSNTKAAIALQKFTAEFGQKPSGRNEQWVRDSAGHTPGPIA